MLRGTLGLLGDQTLLEFQGGQLYDLEQTAGARRLLEELRAGRHELLNRQPTLEEVQQVADDLAATATPTGHLPLQAQAQERQGHKEAG